MKKRTSQTIILAAIAGLVVIVGCKTCPNQAEFPRITHQPEDQLVPMGATATFVVKAINGPLAYQWVRNGAVLTGQTNSSLTVEKAEIHDVGFYSCNVSKEWETVPTRAASLMVYTNYVPAGTVADPVVVFTTPVVSGGSSGSCPGPYAGYVNYTKTVAQGWGWAPATNTTVHTATDTNRSNTKVFYVGKNFDSGCNQTSVTVPHPPVSTKYRFTIYFTNNVPTGPYSIVLDGFNP